MSIEAYFKNAVTLWASEDRPYWKQIRESVIDDALIGIYGMEPRK